MKPVDYYRDYIVTSQPYFVLGIAGISEPISIDGGKGGVIIAPEEVKPKDMADVPGLSPPEGRRRSDPRWAKVP